MRLRLRWFSLCGGPFSQSSPIDFYILEYPGYGGRSEGRRQSTFVSAADMHVESSENCGIFHHWRIIGEAASVLICRAIRRRVKGVFFFVGAYNNMGAAEPARICRCSG